MTLGVIGIGPRSTYNLTAMLQSDVRCVAIAEVQAKRPEAGKALVDHRRRVKLPSHGYDEQRPSERLPEA